jgi:hypothetical protein
LRDQYCALHNILLSEFHDEIDRSTFLDTTARLATSAKRVNIQDNRSTGSSAPKERRRAKRADLRMRANVTLPGDLTLESHTIDISLNGLGCRVPYALELGQSCTIELDLKKFGLDLLELQTVVRSCRQNSDGKYQAGLEFLDPPETITAMLRSLLP